MNKLLILVFDGKVARDLLRKGFSRTYLIAAVVLVSIIILTASFSLSDNLGNTTTTNSLVQSSVSSKQFTSTAINSATSTTDCPNCVIISTVFLNAESQGMNSECWNQGPSVSTQYLGEVLGPNSGSSRIFSYTFYFADSSANNMQGGGYCDMMATVLNITLSNSPPLPFGIVSISPTLPASINAGSQMGFTLNFEASNQSYEGPLTIVMLMA